MALEKYERSLIKKYEKVCTITGPYYEELLTMPNLIYTDESHIVPNGYWKIIKYTGRDNCELDVNWEKPGLS